MEKEHAHINGGGCNKLATCLLSSSWGEGGSAARAQFLKNIFFHFDHFSQKKWKKNTRTSTVAAVTSSPRVCFHLPGVRVGVLREHNF